MTHEELIGPRRNANIAKARHIAIYLAIEMCEMTTTAVGAEFGNRNHSTISTSYKKVQKMIQEDRTVTEDLKSLRDKITLVMKSFAQVLNVENHPCCTQVAVDSLSGSDLRLWE